MLRLLPILVLLTCTGCLVTQPQDTPVAESKLTEPITGRTYWLYVPSTYDAQRTWPLVITLHGTHGWDSPRAQVREWKALAEEKGLIVAAPQLRSAQGLLPAIPAVRAKDLAADEQAVLSTLDDVLAKYRVDRENVLLTGFSGGGYAMYHIGLRHGDRFSMLIAREANFGEELLEGVEATGESAQMPIMIFWGKDEFAAVQRQSWEAYRCLRQRGFANTRHREVEGGQLRRPELAYRYWAEARARARVAHVGP